MSYIPTSVRCTGTVRHRAGLMRGVDPYGYWEDEPRPRFEFDPAVTQARENAVRRYNEARDEQVALKTTLFEQA